jgi:hypothetical protein
MAITRRPKLAPSSAVDVEALINKGGSVAQPLNEERSASKQAQVKLRLPTELLAQVDQALKGRRITIPRHTWLIEAIVEKLERECSSTKPS